MTDYFAQKGHGSAPETAKGARRRRLRQTVRAGGQSFVILRHWDNGFALDSTGEAPLRGLVDLYEGERHLCKALIMPGEVVDGAQSYEVKLANPVATRAPLVDFVPGTPETLGLD